MTKDFLKDAGKYLPAQAVPGFVGFISIAIFTRLFSPQDYGNYSLTMATITLLSTLLGWLPMSIIRFYPAYERDEKLDSFYGNIINLTFISILAITLLFFTILSSIKAYISPQLYSLMCVGIGLFSVSGIFGVLQQFLRAKRHVNWYTGFAMWRSIGSLGIALLLIFLLKRGIESLLWGAILCIVITLPLLWRKGLEVASGFHFNIDSVSTKEMSRYGFPLVMGNLAAWILSLSDRYILEFFRGTQEVGIYSANYNIADRSVMLIVSLFWLASRPISMHIWEIEGETKSKEYVNKITRYYLIASFFAVTGLSVLSRTMITIMTEERYVEGYIIIPFVTLGLLLLGLQHIFQEGFIYYKKTIYITFAIVASGFLNILLNFVFIPRYGYFGAAITTFISYSFLLFLMIIFSRRFFVWKFPFKSLVKVTCASVVTGVIVYPIGNSLSSSMLLNLVFGIFVGAFVYFVMLFLLGEPRKEEIEGLRVITYKIFGKRTR